MSATWFSPACLAHSAGSTLDAVLSKISDSSRISGIEVIEETGTTSDHFLIEFKIPVLCAFNSISSKTVTFRDYSSFDLDGFVLDILSSDLSNCEKFVNLDNAIRLYDDILNSLINKHAPIKTKVVTNKNKRPKWWNADCQQAQRNRRQAE